MWTTGYVSNRINCSKVWQYRYLTENSKYFKIVNFYRVVVQIRAYKVNIINSEDIETYFICLLSMILTRQEKSPKFVIHLYIYYPLHCLLMNFLTPL